MNPVIKTAVAVIGGGSGGVAAAVASARSGADTILIERDVMLGGNSTVAGVNCYEPVAGAEGFPREFYERLRQIPASCGIYTTTRHCCFMDGEDSCYPGGEQRIDPTLSYDDTLKKNWDYSRDWMPGMWNGIIFESESWNQVATKFLKEVGCRILTGRSVVDVDCSGREINSVTLDDGTRIEAQIWIDNAGIVAKKSGCELLHGIEARSMFHEPHAPEQADPDFLNGVSRIFRITLSETPGIEALPDSIPEQCFWAETFPPMVATQYADGDFNCNMLPTFSGREFRQMGESAACIESERRVKSFWHHIQTHWPEFRRYRIKYLFPRLGIRDSFRVFCRYMLNENDILLGLARQSHPDIIAIADHSIDRHGEGGGDQRITGPYGIPYRSLVARDMDNLLLAGRIAGFSGIAASSCRLSRTIMNLGYAAGSAAAIAIESGRKLPDIDVNQLLTTVRSVQK